jgi:hypothetical protein
LNEQSENTKVLLRKIDDCVAKAKQRKDERRGAKAVKIHCRGLP